MFYIVHMPDIDGEGDRDSFFAMIELYKGIPLLNNNSSVGVVNCTILKAQRVGREEIKVIHCKDIMFKCIFQSSPHYGGDRKLIICTKLLSHVSMSQVLDDN